MGGGQVQQPMRVEDVFRECYNMGKVRHKSGRFWEQLLARGKRHITAIHMEVHHLTGSSVSIEQHVHVAGLQR